MKKVVKSKVESSKADKAADKKAGIAEGSPLDNREDAKLAKAGKKRSILGKY